MRRALAVIVAAAVTLPASAAGAPNRVSATGDEQSETEMSLILSRAKVDPGRAIIQFINSGEDVHDLQVKRKGAQDVQRETGMVDPGQQDEVELKLRRDSRYQLWCSVADHRDLGMEATLKVKRR